MPKVRGLVPFVGTALFLACAVGLFGFANSTNPIDVVLGRGRLITAPNVIDRALPAAEVEVERAGFKSTARRAYSTLIPRGAVMDQAPKPGKHGRAGDTMVLTVSRGVNRATMPDAVGKPLAEIKAPLVRADIRIKVAKIPSETVPEGVVISQNPDPGVIVSGRDVASFEVSSGPEKRSVPEVAGLTPDGAASRLGSAGLTLGELTIADDPTVPAGAVVSASPAVGKVVPRDTPVSLVVSAGPVPVVVPDVTGTALDAATASLTALGFRVEVAGRLLANDDPESGKIFEQRPAAGQLLRPGQSATIVAGRAVGPPITTTTTTTTTATRAPPSTGGETTTEPSDEGGN